MIAEEGNLLSLPLSCAAEGIYKINRIWQFFLYKASKKIINFFSSKCLTNRQECDTIKAQRGGQEPPQKKGYLIMYDYNITAQEMADFVADMLEMASDTLPTDEEMAEMAAWYGED
jgi:hypothetical protein